MFQSKTAGESDSEREDMELSEISKVLEKHDPSFNKLACMTCVYASKMTLPPHPPDRLTEQVVIFLPTTSSVWAWRD